MSHDHPDPMLDRLAALAREQEPPALSDDAAADMVRLAMQRANVAEGAKETEPAPVRNIWLRRAAFAAAAAVIPLVLWFGFLSGQSPTTIELAT